MHLDRLVVEGEQRQDAGGGAGLEERLRVAFGESIAEVAEEARGGYLALEECVWAVDDFERAVKGTPSHQVGEECRVPRQDM